MKITTNKFIINTTENITVVVFTYSKYEAVSEKCQLHYRNNSEEDKSAV